MTKIIDLEEKRQERDLRRATVDMMDAFKRVAERVKQQLEEGELAEHEPDGHEPVDDAEADTDGEAADDTEDP